MGDKLSAASLLLTAVAIIYSLWYPEISRALKIVPKPHKPDNRAEFKEVGRLLMTRSLPLFLISLALAAIFVPDSVEITRETYAILGNPDLRAHSRYDAVSACFLAVTTLTILFAGHLTVLTAQLAALRRRLNPEG
jgi:hypothetical protein